jgi:hypothetical protein
MDKLDKVVAGLEPAMLDSLAEDGYVRNRHDDLSIMAADRRPARSARTHRAGTRRERWSLLAGGIAAVGTASAVVAVFALPGGKAALPTSSAVSPSTSAAVPSTRAVLLAASTVAARSSAATGTYWYARERDFEPAVARSGGNTKSSGHTKNGVKALFFGATFASTEETWSGATRIRTIVNEDLAFTFASAADKARWVAAGKPPLSTAAGFGFARPLTNNYSAPARWGVGVYTFSVAGIQRLPSTAKLLGQTLGRMWVHEPDKAGAVGFANPSFAQYLVAWADALLTAPSRPGTRAAIYQLLAQEPGLSIVPGVTDPLGRVGVAIGDGGGDYLIIQPSTAKLLAYTSNPVRAKSAIPATGGVEVYELSGWASQLGVAP